MGGIMYFVKEKTVFPINSGNAIFWTGNQWLKWKSQDWVPGFSKQDIEKDKFLFNFRLNPISLKSPEPN
jgi:hypothetical protein